ncbi:hypothetical protein ABFS82_09G131200 [Erythranthe guttata]|uniref:Glutamate receptor n=1 Tax=Erythranthe guttata TaxID=4155 RepID=A0A022Q404_ERYGU|nr:hypothetical protein MIMGU_mgv1a025791mg [Erythranthe guttata]
MKIHFSILFLSVLSLFLSFCNSQRNTTFQVGVVLDANSTNGRIGMTSLSLALSDFYSSHANYSTRIVLHPRDSGPQVTFAAASALNLLKDVQVDAIIGPQTSAQANFVAGLGDAAKVPIISFTATSPSLRPQTPYFVRTAINDSAQVEAVAAIVKYFRWHRVVFIYEDTDYGNGIIPLLSIAFQQVNARVSYRSVIPASATGDFILQELHNMKKMQTRVFVVHTTALLASRIFLKAKEAEMMSEGYAWIVTSGLMNLFYSLEPSVVDSMQGVVGVKPHIPGSRKLKSTTVSWKKKFVEINPMIPPPREINIYGLWAYDTLSALAMAAEKTGFREPSYLQNTNALNSTDIFITGTSQTGPNLLAATLDTNFTGLSGNFRLINGKLEPSSFEILYVNGTELTQVGLWKPILQIPSQMNANITGFAGKKLKNITWPGESRNVPKGWEVSASGKKLRVGVPANIGFPQFVNVEKDNITGLYVDLFKYVMAALPYTVEYEFIPFEISNASTAVQTSNASSAGSYDDLSYQVFNGNFDAAVGDITITSARSEYVDFTFPIAQGGITRTQKIPHDDENKGKYFFVQPLKRELWLTAIAMFIFTGVAMWILEHRFNRDFRGPPSEHAGLIFYIPFMTLAFANRERIVSNLARLVLVVWVFVVLILSSTYTASLSAIFTINKLDQNGDSDVSRLIRNGDYVGCREGSFIYEFVKRLGFDESKIRTYKLPQDFHIALAKGSENGGIKAMFSRTPYTDVFLSMYCNKTYMKVGSTYFTEGSAFVFPKGSPLVADVSRAIIKQTDNHNISKTNEKGIEKTCGEYDPDFWQTVELKSFKVLFGITAGITGTCLVAFLFSYFYKNRDVVRRIFSNSETTTWSKLNAISMHFDRRDPKSFRFCITFVSILKP